MARKRKKQVRKVSKPAKRKKQVRKVGKFVKRKVKNVAPKKSTKKIKSTLSRARKTLPKNRKSNKTKRVSPRVKRKTNRKNTNTRSKISRNISGSKNRKVKKSVKTRIPSRHKRKSTLRKPRKIRLEFLERGGVPRQNYAAYHLPWEFHRLDGDNLVSIHGDQLEKLVNGWRARFTRGIDTARIIINYGWRRSGKYFKKAKTIKRAVGTSRRIMNDDGAWQDLLADFSRLVLTLYDYDLDKFDEEGVNEAKIFVESVVLELLHIEDTGSIEIP